MTENFDAEDIQLPCFDCGNEALTEKGVIYYRAQLPSGKWDSVELCLDCFKTRKGFSAEAFEAKNYGHKRFRKDTPAPVRTVKYKKTQCKALTKDGYPCPNPIQWDRRDRGDYCGHHHRNRQETVKTITKEEAEKRKKETADLMAWAMKQDFHAPSMSIISDDMECIKCGFSPLKPVRRASDGREGWWCSQCRRFFPLRLTDSEMKFGFEAEVVSEEVMCNDCLWGGAHSELIPYRDMYGDYEGCPKCKSDHLIDFTGQNKYAESFNAEKSLITSQDVNKLIEELPYGGYVCSGPDCYNQEMVFNESQMCAKCLSMGLFNCLGCCSREFGDFTHENGAVLEAEDRPEEERMTRPQAEALAGKMVGLLEPSCSFIEVAGSYRRGREDPGDLDIVVILKPRETLPNIVESLAEEYSSVSWVGEKKAQIIVDGVKVDIRVSTPRALGAALLYFTGPAGYNIGIRRSAKSRGMKLNEYGIFDRETNEYLGGATEEEIYAILGKNYRPPEERRAEGRQEFNSAVIFPKSWNSAGPIEKTIILHTALQEARLQEALLELETNIRLGVISEKQAMRMFMNLLK